MVVILKNLKLDIVSSDFILFKENKIKSNNTYIKNYIKYNKKIYRAYKHKGTRKIYHIELCSLIKHISYISSLNQKDFNNLLYTNKDSITKLDIMSFRFNQPKDIYKYLVKDNNKCLIRDDENTFTNKEVVSKFKKENSRIYSMIFYGKVQNINKWKCLVTKEPIMSKHPFIKDKETGTYDLHHIKVINGTSVDKNNKEPSSYIKSPLDNKKFNEIIRCILVNRKAHNAIHDFRNTDIRSYKKHYLPYILKSKLNYEKVIKWVISNTNIEKSFETYEKVIDSLLIDNPDIILNKI